MSKPIDPEQVNINYNFTGPGLYFLWTLDAGSLVTELGECDTDQDLLSLVNAVYADDHKVRERLDSGERMVASRKGHLA